MNDDSNIVDLGQYRVTRAEDPAAPPLRSAPRTSVQDCYHMATVVDIRKRRVVCDACGVELDPYEVLSTLARGMDRFLAAEAEAKHRAKEAQERLDALLREERNARARARRRNE